jgi:hypothetical protein
MKIENLLINKYGPISNEKGNPTAASKIVNASALKNNCGFDVEYENGQKLQISYEAACRITTNNPKYFLK